MMAGVNCTGSQLGTYDELRFSSPSSDTIWVSYGGYSFTPPAGTVSVRISIFAINQWLDQMYVNPQGSWF
jgi:hypothetical protein